MLTKKLLLCSSLLAILAVGYLSVSGAPGKVKADEEEKSRLVRKVQLLPDSLFESVEKEDLLNDEVYLKLAHEGWSREEIVTIMETAIADKAAAKKKIGYGYYKKQWLPTYGRQPGGDSLYMFIDTLYTSTMQRSVAKSVPEDLLNAYWPPIEYIPPKQRSGGGQENQRIPGYFRCPQFKPFCGRIHWIEIHPENPDRFYVVPDGAGIYKTDDCGENWECITDHIPDRVNRSNSPGYAIPVDPDDWDHLFAFMNNATVYETFDGGQSWTRVEGATHKTFKRGGCFRDKEGNLKFVGATNIGWNSKLWISEDKCKTWTEVEIPTEMKDINPSTGARGLWFQYIVPDPSDRDKIYFPTSRSIFYFDDGAKSEIVNGKRVYNIKKMEFEVYDQDHNERRYPGYPGDKGADVTNNTIFPCPATTVGDLSISPLEPNKMWFATGSYLVSGVSNSALYYSEDYGKTWSTKQDLIFGIGQGNIYGNELANTWLGGFGVNYVDTNKLYGCSMSSASSSDGGKTFNNLIWWAVIPHKHTDGNYYSVSASRHNADNHFVRSHKSGRVFRGSDGGMLMLDPEVNNGNWVQIGGNMGQMLFYHVAVNEFGDQVIAGNTQDIDGQTYRYGRWGKWRGYEGCESFINPYTSAVYFPSTGYQGLDPEMINIDSWQNGQTRADVVTGSWYTMRTGSKTYGRSLLRCDDMGQKLYNLEPAVGEAIGMVGKFGLCRDKGRSTIYVVTNSHIYKRSIDNGNTFETLYDPNGNPLKFSNTVIATDPNNSDIIYIGNNKGVVYKYDFISQQLTQMGTGLPQIPCTNLLFHEGSGDLYFFHAASAGIYILEYDKQTGQYAPEWRYWTKGYNASKATNVEINYTTQEMVLCDYGHSVWVADLEHPSDRFFDNGFGLKEISNKAGRRTMGIDTEWFIPLYYHYKWTVNGEDVDNPYQYLQYPLKAGDRVQLELTLRESPEVHTLSAEYTIPEEGMAEESIEKLPGHAIYSNGHGRLDIGYTDYFFKDFTIDMWLKPNTSGTILSNTTRNSDAKGFELSVEGDALKFQYFPLNQIVIPYYEQNDGLVQNATLKASGLKLGQWNHVAITHEREGFVTMYINGQAVASAPRINPEGSLNNSCILSLFADAIEYYPIDAAVDELKIWSRSLSIDEVRKEMHSTNVDNTDGLVAYYPFNGGSLENEREVFSRHSVKSRIKAEVNYPMMSVPICAKHVVYDQVTDSRHTFSTNDKDLLSISSMARSESESALSGNIGVYAFDASQWQNEEDNLDTDYFDYYPVGYLIHPFDGTSGESSFSLEMYPIEGEFDANKEYRLYAAGISSDKQAWEHYGDAVYNAENGSLIINGLSLSTISDKKLLIATAKPSIEIQVEGMGADGILSVYDESQSVFPMSARILSGLEEPEDIYEIEPDGIVKASGLYFTQGKANGELRLDLDKLGSFNTSVRATLRSNDNPVKLENGKMRPSLIPLTVDVRNRIMPRELGTALKIVNGRADIGNSVDAAKINDTRNLTIMGWLRMDSLKNINAPGFDIILLQHSGSTSNHVTGIRVNRGQLEYFQSVNGKYTSLKNANHTFKATDVGIWKHVAAVLDSVTGKVTLYMNGMPQQFTYNAAVDPVVGFHIGKNSGYGVTAAADNFCGAVDQVGVWTRALSQDEIIKYMYTVPSLDDPTMAYYLNMDYSDDGTTMRDTYTNAEIKTLTGTGLTGSASFDEPIAVPFEARAIVAATATDSPISLTFPTGKQRNPVVATFRGAPYCYFDHDFQQYSALANEFYAVTYKDFSNATPAATDTVTMKYKHRSITDGENIAVAMRKTGTTEHLSGFIHASEVTAGEATFKVPATFLSAASEVMFFTYPDEEDDGTAARLANIQLGFPRSIIGKIKNETDIPTIMLTEDMDSIPMIADIFRMPGNGENPVKIIVNETEYASASVEDIDFSKSENQFSIKLDMDKINPFDLNTLTVNLEGAEANEIKLNFYLEPTVYLTLRNGEHSEVLNPESAEDMGDAEMYTPSIRRARLRKVAETQNTITSPTAIGTLEVNAEMLQGYLPNGEKVQLEVVTDLEHAMNIGNGTLFHNQEVKVGELEYFPSDGGSLYEGWNLIGNPYLANVNLTMAKNIKYDPTHVTKYIYQNDPETGNYRVFNMTDYDVAHKILPFQSYFVQTMQSDATFTVTPVAKETGPNKKTLEYDALEKHQITFSLMKDGKEMDEVTAIYDKDADKQFVVNEDASKKWNLTGSSPELFSNTYNDVAAAVNVSDADDVSLGIKSPETEQLVLQVKSISGFDQNEIEIQDNVTGEKFNPFLTGNNYTFTAAQGETDNRFNVILRSGVPTGTDVTGISGYKVTVEGNKCIVSGLRGNASVKVHIPSGVTIAGVQTSEPMAEFTLDNGVYLVVIHENGKDYTSKIKM